MTLIAGLLILGATLFANDYMDDGNDQIWLLSHKTLYLLAGILLLVGLLLSSLFILSKKKSVNNKINHNTVDPDITKITRQRKKYIKNINSDEKEILRKFSPDFLNSIYLECTPTLATLCKKEILKSPIGYNVNRATGVSHGNYELYTWSRNYLLKHPNLLN